MDPIVEYPIRRIDAGGQAETTDKVVAEARIELDVNDGRHRLGLLCLPRDLEALAVGLLVNEGALRRREDLTAVEARCTEGRVCVRGDFDDHALAALTRRWTRGTAGGRAPEPTAPPRAPAAGGLKLAADDLVALARRFRARGELWRQTGGVHACALAGADGIVVFAEDVGRHNAFDKVVGRAVLDGVALDDKLLLTTGRVSGEIVSKAAACGLAMLASRSAVTDLAVKLAQRSGITLVGFLRGRRMNVYSGFERIDAGAQGPA